MPVSRFSEGPTDFKNAIGSDLRHLKIRRSDVALDLVRYNASPRGVSRRFGATGLTTLLQRLVSQGLGVAEDSSEFKSELGIDWSL